MSDTGTLAQALLAFQADAPPIHLDATNPHFNSKFASLAGVVAAVRPALNRHGLVFSQPTTNLGGIPALRTTLIHAPSGEQLDEVTPLVLAKNDPQGYGSALTYARRYSLLSILGLVGDDDDDANSAQPATPRAATGSAFAPPPSAPQPKPAPAAPASESDPTAYQGDDPGLVRVHFGRNAGKPLAELSSAQRKFYAESWNPDVTKFPLKPQDGELRRAARILCGLQPLETEGPFAAAQSTGGGDEPDIPFAPTVYA